MKLECLVLNKISLSLPIPKKGLIFTLKDCFNL